jgi:hypothetical protein
VEGLSGILVAVPVGRIHAQDAEIDLPALRTGEGRDDLRRPGRRRRLQEAREVGEDGHLVEVREALHGPHLRAHALGEVVDGRIGGQLADPEPAGAVGERGAGHRPRPGGHPPWQPSSSLRAAREQGVEMPGKTRRAKDRARRRTRQYALHPIRAQRRISR